jgi:D-alanine-D-alanine ligase
VVESLNELLVKIQELLVKYPAGLVVEEYISGRDVVVPFLEKASPQTGGILAAGEYVFDEKAVRDRKYRIYDFALKHSLSDAVEVKVPALLSPTQEQEIRDYSRKIYRVLGVRDLGRIDFRISDEGKIHFIEINALPSLEPGASMYKSAGLAGLGTTEEVLNAVLRSAATRHGLQLKSEKSRRAATPLRVGFTYNLKRIVPKTEVDDDREAEYDSPKTVDSIREAIASFGHTVIPLEATSELPSILPSVGVDVVFNIAEGLRGRSREAQVPAILELLDIPYTGSDPATLSLSLDKSLAKRIVRQAGVSTANFLVMQTGKEKLPKDLAFPVVIKPLAEGSSKGVIGTSVAQNEIELREYAREMVQRYGQPALVEEYLTGREFTVALLGERKPKVLPAMEIVFTNSDDRWKLYSFKHKLDVTPEIRYDAPAKLDTGLQKEIERVAKTCFAALGCRDVARIDLRLDSRGRVNFIECNPLPGLTPGWSDLCLIAQSAGMDYRTLIGEILSPVIKRFREKERLRKMGKEPGAWALSPASAIASPAPVTSANSSGTSGESA